MLLKSKQIWLASLVLILTTKLANACSVESEFKEEAIKHLAERDSSVKLFFFLTVLMIAANIALFFYRKKNDYILGFAIIVTALVSATITFFAMLKDTCGDTIVGHLRINFYIFLSFLVLQVCLWLKGVGLRFKQEEPAVDFT